MPFRAQVLDPRIGRPFDGEVHVDTIDVAPRPGGAIVLDDLDISATA